MGFGGLRAVGGLPCPTPWGAVRGGMGIVCRGCLLRVLPHPFPVDNPLPNCYKIMWEINLTPPRGGRNVWHVSKGLSERGNNMRTTKKQANEALRLRNVWMAAGVPDLVTNHEAFRLSVVAGVPIELTRKKYAEFIHSGPVRLIDVAVFVAVKIHKTKEN